MRQGSAQAPLQLQDSQAGLSKSTARRGQYGDGDRITVAVC